MKTFVTVTLLAGVILTGSLHAADFQYKLIHTIPIGGKGGWDYLSVDPASRQLFVSHGDEVVVIDLGLKDVVGTISNTPGVHGLAPCSDLGIGVTSDGRINAASIVNLTTYQTLAKVKTAAGPDGLLYDPTQQEAYIFCGRAHAATVINVKTRKAVATIPLPGRPEFGAVDPAANRVYDNIVDKNEIAVIDTQSQQVITNWPVAPGAEPSAMAIDAKNKHLFVGCRNQKLLMINSTNGRIQSVLPIGAGVDACVYDRVTHLVFASCGDGTTTIAHVNEDEGKMKLVETLKTEPGARTMAVDPMEHDIYLATAKMVPSTKSRWHHRIIPGTFKVLVYEPR